ncbi:MAG: YicC/YloC family endoribonuclease [Tepidamorphaceae bacterium]
MTTRNGALASMTGFAAVSGAACGYQWEWTLRSVNGKGLDLRFRLPGGYERLETVLRGTASGKLSRGSVSANLGLKRESEQPAELVINPAALDAVSASPPTSPVKPVPRQPPWMACLPCAA